MKIIDLLQRIANGEEVPKKIKFDNKEYENEPCYMLYEATGERNELQFKKFLNDEVEIIEEEKKIPEKICTNRIINTKDILEFEMIQNKINAEYTNVINWILDYLKSKGE